MFCINTDFIYQIKLWSRLSGNLKPRQVFFKFSNSAFYAQQHTKLGGLFLQLLSERSNIAFYA